MPEAATPFDQATPAVSIALAPGGTTRNGDTGKVCSNIDGTKGAASRAAAAASLPCLSSNNSTEEGEEGTVHKLTGGHKRMAFVLSQEIQHLAKDFGLERIGFLTLTFADNVQSLKEAQRRFNSLNTHVLKARYTRAIGVWERQGSGRIHFHLVVVLNADVRTGFDFSAIARRDYRSANVALRSEWKFWRDTAPKYRFGRTELLPVKSTAEGIARYVGSYVSKHIGQRRHEDKGARTVRFIGFRPGTRRYSCRFAWNTVNAWLWRQKVGAFAGRFGIEDMDQLKQVFGRRWAWRLYEQILAQRIDEHEDIVYPSLEHAERAKASENEHDGQRVAAQFAHEKGVTHRNLDKGQGLCRARQHLAPPALRAKGSGRETVAGAVVLGSVAATENLKTTLKSFPSGP